MTSRLKYRNSDEIYCVYQLIDPRTNKPFYIGEGFESRLYVHWHNFINNTKHNKKDKNEYKQKIFNELKKLNLTPIHQYIIKNITKEKALKIETFFIKKLGRLCNSSGILSNILEDSRNNPMKNLEVRTRAGNSIKEFYKTEEGMEMRKKYSKSMKKTIEKLFSGEEGEKFKLILRNAVSLCVRNLIWINDNNRNEMRIHIESEIPKGWRRGKLKRKWIHNESFEKQIIKNESIPEGWMSGRLYNKSTLNKKIINDGQREYFLDKNVDLPEGYILGRLNFCHGGTNKTFFINNGATEKQIKIEEIIPFDFVKGRLKNHKYYA